MKVVTAILLATMLLAGTAQAEPRCEAHIERASRHYGIPAGILLGIAMVESNFRLRPHPWTIAFLDGSPSIYAPSLDAARPYLRRADGKPRTDISIGCMQLNMAWHLKRVRTPEWGIDPEVNVWYAAAYLRELYDRRKSWTRAVIDYNGDTDPAARIRYACAVDSWMRRVYRLPVSEQRKAVCSV
ncbi:transglycosylase SLT domain-containing protein [Roseiterribacter gracilis]|uniref:Lytic transglycosylase n=1 Tax=Roseiterribacter gracilis TaxID=2812848 RepID=A0A8S8XA06_9PROT|nr:lytic transglycosylase [Rhodospirillales bacterium TMPK1]